jgi:U2-associated protein SR140
VFFFIIIKGDSICKWKTKPFQMFKNGSYWQPPPVNRFTTCSRDESYERAYREIEVKKGKLANEYITKNYSFLLL